MDLKSVKETGGIKQYLTRKSLLGLTFGLLLALIVLCVDKKLWLPLELETISGRNTNSWINQSKLNTKDIVVILFDDKTQFLLRQNGLPIKDFEKRGRGLIDLVIQKLEASGVKSIGINLNLSTPSDTKSDEKFAKTISSFKNIVIADSIQSSSSNNILKGARGIGYGELYADYDKIVHKIKLVEKGYKDIPSFSYVLYKTSSGKDAEQNLKNNNEFYLKYPENSFSKISLIDLIQGRVSPNNLKGKTILLGIGLNSKLIKDQLLSPFSKKSFISDSEVQAIALANLFTNSYLFKFSFSDYPLLFVLLSMILGIIFGSMPTVRRLIFGTLLFITLIVFGQIAYNNFQTVIEIVPIFFLLLGDLIIGSLVFLQLNLQEQNLELEDALIMLNKRSKELENSKHELQHKNIELNGTLSELNKRVKELKDVRKQLSTKSEEERKRIARELHDDTLARITDLRRYIESLINSQELTTTGKKELGVSIQTLDNVTHEVRRIINALRPSMLDNILGLIPAIENLLDELAKRSNHRIQTRLTTKISKLKLSESNEINLYRIIQEALNNVYKHSNATKVEILIKEQPGQILILVNDNGCGFNTNHDTKGFGLIDMQERAELIGGHVQYLNKPKDTGTTLEITVQLDKILEVQEASASSDLPWRTPTVVT